MTLDAAVRYAFAALCLYEGAALISRRLPPVTRLCCQWPILEGAVGLLIDYHLGREVRRFVGRSLAVPSC